MSAMDSSKSNWFFESELFISDIHFVHSVLAFCTPIISCCKLETSVLDSFVRNHVSDAHFEIELVLSPNCSSPISTSFIASSHFVLQYIVMQT